MYTYCTTTQPVMFERVQLTNVVVPTVQQVAQIVREPGYITNTQAIFSPPRLTNLYASQSPARYSAISQYGTNQVKEVDKTLILKRDLQSQLDKLMSKLDQMDNTLNDLTHEVHQINHKTTRKHEVIDEDETSTKVGTTTQKKYHTPGRDPKENYGESRFRESQVTEFLTKVQLQKGIRFDDCYYFGDLDISGVRNGFGALYDSKGRLIYCGYWHKNRFHNRGKLYFYDLPKKPYLALESFKDYHYVKNNRLSYTGQFVMGEMKGLGQMQFQVHENQKIIFYGRFVGGIFHGKGTVLSYEKDLDKSDSIGLQGEWSEGRQIKGSSYYQRADQ